MPINVALKNVQIDFYDEITNELHYIVDTGPFNKNAYNDIKINGHFLTDLNLIHCASIHYQSRFRTDISRRLKYTLDTIEPSLIDDRDSFYFDNYEESELQKNSSEVIGVGFAISLFQKLLDVNFNCINRIPVTGRMKRCDYEILKNGSTFILESKGRKGGLNKAVKEIFEQKSGAGLGMAKYGCISLIERNGNPVTITVVDPPREYEMKSKEVRILDILVYYTKCIQLSGFYNLARHLNIRINRIIQNLEMIEKYNNMPIEYDNVLKSGLGYEITLSDSMKFEMFVARSMQVGLRRTLKFEEEEYVLSFGMDPQLIKIIENQDFDALLEYRTDDNLFIENANIVSVHNDGTFLSVLPKEIFHGMIV